MESKQTVVAVRIQNQIAAGKRFSERDEYPQELTRNNPLYKLSIRSLFDK